MTSPHVSDARRRTRDAWLIAAVGALLVVLHLPHLLTDLEEGMGHVALLTGAVVPMLLAVAIVGAGVWLRGRELDPGYLGRIGLWFGLGMVALAIVGGMSLLYELAEGATLAHAHFVLLNFLTAGGLAGLLVGWYDVRNRYHADRLRGFRQAVEHSGHCIYLTDTDGTITYVNPAFEAQTGFSREESIGADPRILKSGVHDRAFYAELWETIRSGAVWRGELVNRRKDGSTHHVDQTIAPIEDAHGEIERYVAINTDITAIKEYEAELERQNERLEAFAGVVSHDLRNPLNVAQGRFELLTADCDSEHLEPIRRALSRMEHLISDVLELARQGQAVGDLDPVELSRVSTEAWEAVDTGEAELVIEDEVAVEADGGRFRRLLENLFRNAVEHGGERVTVRVGGLDGGFYVEDTGAGIPEEERARVLRPGYTTADDGTGLGLAIVKQVADVHGWEVDVTRGDPGGARFEITGVEPLPTRCSP